MKPYPLQLEISGPTAMWTRPDTGSSPLSYVAPTFSAVKGIFEAILLWKSVNVRPARCEICAPVQFHRYAFNYGGPLRNPCSADLQSAVSRICNPLPVAHSRALGDSTGLPTANRRYSRLKICATTKAHAYVDAFHRRLERGRFPSPIGWERVPQAGEGGGLGWKEFVPDYVGPFRDGTAPCVTENHVNPACLKRVLNQPQNAANGSVN